MRINAKRILLAFKAAALEEHPACGGIRGTPRLRQIKKLTLPRGRSPVLKGALPPILKPRL